jgi:hypothetical protein
MNAAFSDAFVNSMQCIEKVTSKQQTCSRIYKQTLWPKSASELYQPSDRRLSARLVPTFVDGGVSRSQHVLVFNILNFGIGIPNPFNVIWYCRDMTSVIFQLFLSEMIFCNSAVSSLLICKVIIFVSSLGYV